MRPRRWTAGLAALIALATPGLAAAADPPAITATATPDYTTSLAPGPDGGLWTMQQLVDWREGYVAVRHGADGSLRTVRLSWPDGAPVTVLRSGLFPLADGGVGVIVAQRSDDGFGTTHAVALARVAPGATGARLTVLPQEARRAAGFAVAGDGTVWFGRACDDSIYRRDPSGRLAHYALRRLTCRGESAMTLGPDGSAWLVNLGQRRVARVDVRGRVREWRTDGADRWGPTGTPVLAADPRGGGLAFQDGGSSGIAGRITPSGRLLSLSVPRQDRTFAAAVAYGRDGTLWRSVQRGIERISPRGARRFVPFSAEMPNVADLTLARDGSPWFLAGRFAWEWGSNGYGGWYEDAVLGQAGAAGVMGTWRPAPPADAGHRLELRGEDGASDAELALGPDGALWATVMDFTLNRTRLVRALPAGLARPRPARAAVRRVLARSGRTVWLQLACGADRSRFCRGTVWLRGTAKSVRFVVEGANRGAVRLTLGKRAWRTLRRGRAIRTTAVVRSIGWGTARRALMLRR